MNRDYKIVQGIYLIKDTYNLDLHNNFNFKSVEYSVSERKAVLHWKRSNGDWVNSETPKALEIEFSGVSEFRFMPRDSDMPFTEDDCVNSIGYWVDEDWAEGIIMVEPNQKPEPQWLTAIDFMSGAVITVQAERASAKVMA
jgi:hypothetical protein